MKTRKTPEPRGQMERSKVMMQASDGVLFGLPEAVVWIK